MKKWFPLLMTAILLAGCIPNFKEDNEVIQKNEETVETAIIPNYQISNSYYRSMVPFKVSKTRGMVVSNLHSKYDINEFETGLMRVAKEQFSTEEYLFQEGQYLDKEIVSGLLNRKFTKAQLKERKLIEEDNIGLNPLNDEKGSVDEQNQKNPIYLAHILEHDYLVKTDKGVNLGGVVIGLAMNSVHYYQREKYGATFQQEITHAELAKEGKEMAEQILKRLRGMKELSNVPITIALFEQQSKNSIVPGNFFAYANVDKGSATIKGWKDIKEQHLLFPSQTAEKEHRDDLAKFLAFKDEIEKYFPNYNGVIGRAFYKGDQLVDLSIEIPIQLYGEAEIIGFTQLAASLVVNYFPEYIEVEVSITSVNGAEALIVRQAGEKDPFVHIY